MIFLWAWQQLQYVQHSCIATGRGLLCSLRYRHHYNGHRDQSDSTGLRSCRRNYKQSHQDSWYKRRCRCHRKICRKDQCRNALLPNHPIDKNAINGNIILGGTNEEGNFVSKRLHIIYEFLYEEKQLSALTAQLQFHSWGPPVQLEVPASLQRSQRSFWQ